MNNSNEMNNAELPSPKTQQSRSPSGLIAIFAVVLTVAILLTALATFSFTVNTFLPEPEEERTEIDILSDVLDQNAYFTPEYDEMKVAALKAFIAASGDKYAAYYTDEEYKYIRAENEGRYVGIGVSFREEVVVYEGKELNLLKITKINKNSPVAASSIAVGDYLYAVHTDGATQYVDEIGKEATKKLIRGEVGSAITVSYLTKTEDGYDLLQAGLIRAIVENVSVEFSVSEMDSSVGIVKIDKFDFSTPEQLSGALDALIAQGVTKFVLDLRDNGGGLMKSVIACSSYFLTSGSLIVTKMNNFGSTPEFVGYRSYLDGYCTVTNEDIGKYHNYDFVMLINENTASAAELFAAVLRDYNLAESVGVQTYGKGSVQDYISLSSYGMSGVLKLTTSHYYPPCGEGFNEVGITPDLVIPLANGVDINLADEWDDNQLVCAIGKLVQPIE